MIIARASIEQLEIRHRIRSNPICDLGLCQAARIDLTLTPLRRKTYQRADVAPANGFSFN
jgi:hypothetical protein